VAVRPAFGYWYGLIGDFAGGDQTFAMDHRQNVVVLTIGLRLP
jgi:hypothetical protein